MAADYFCYVYPKRITKSSQPNPIESLQDFLIKKSGTNLTNTGGFLSNFRLFNCSKLVMFTYFLFLKVERKKLKLNNSTKY